MLPGRLARCGRLRVPLVSVDSPQATRAREVSLVHLEALDELAHVFRFAQRSGKLPFALRDTESVEDSVFLNSIRSEAVIVAASGMFEAGCVRHRLHHDLPRRACAELSTSFRAAGTLGRRIADGARSVRLFDETIPVRAKAHAPGGLSARAGQDSPMAWLRAVPRRPQAAFIAHGEPEAAHALSARIGRELKGRATVAVPRTCHVA